MKRSYEESVKWFLRAAEQGNACACKNLGEAFFTGTGVERDYEEAVKWYRKAAEGGDAEAQYNLGRCYQYGYGVEADENEAAEWFAKAATDTRLDTVLLLRRLGFGKKE